MMHLAIKEGSTLIQKEFKDLGWTFEDQNDIFDPFYISDAPAKAANQRSHPMQLRSAQVQEVSHNELNTGDLLQSNSVIQWLSW